MDTQQTQVAGEFTAALIALHLGPGRTPMVARRACMVAMRRQA
jgi:hypothetical protein